MSTIRHAKKIGSIVIALSAGAFVTCMPRVARADIFEWEYINPANPSLGKQQSTTLAPDGAGASAVPGANLYSRNLTMAYLIGADLSGAGAGGANLTNADLSLANLTNADFGFYDGGENGYGPGADLTGVNLSQANLTNADFDHVALNGTNLTGADVRGASFTFLYLGDPYYIAAGGMTLAQLYSTASYQTHELIGIGLGGNNLSGVNLASQNLTNAGFSGSTLSNANLSQANLTNAYFAGATLTGANLTGAEVRGAAFSSITTAQLYSTASYLAHDLSGIGLSGIDLTGVNLAGQNLTNANFYSATLTSANLSQANLTDANFYSATLTGANLTGADVRGANFFLGLDHRGTSITVAQLYSTASYHAHDLTGIGLGANYLLAGVNFAGQNLTSADLGFATLTGASFNQANLTNADFSRATLANANFSQANLTNANLFGATLTGANLTGAEVRGAHFQRYSDDIGTITPAQLYSTASYLAHDLTGIGLIGNYAGVNLAGQNLTNAGFSYGYCDCYNESTAAGADLTGANLSQARLTNADFSGSSTPIYDEYGNYLGDYITPGANLTNANLSGADARGASFEYSTLAGANTSNLIQSDGHIAGLDLTAGASLVVRDYDGNPFVFPSTGPLPIVVEQHLAMDATGTLRLVFDADPWDSTISFLPGIPVALGGTLELTFAPGVDVATQSGRTIDLFDWTGVTPTGAFTVSSPYTWNVSNLYTTGEVTLVAVPGFPGDFNNNGVVDAADYVVWRKNYGTPAAYNTWRANFGAVSPGIGAGSGAALPSAEPLSATVPEPVTLALLTFGLPFLAWRNSRRLGAGGIRGTRRFVLTAATRALAVTRSDQ
jgi:uncharacterized protein YjbI with pentapeptide repeats